MLTCGLSEVLLAPSMLTACSLHGHPENSGVQCHSRHSSADAMDRNTFQEGSGCSHLSSEVYYNVRCQ